MSQDIAVYVFGHPYTSRSVAVCLPVERGKVTRRMLDEIATDMMKESGMQYIQEKTFFLGEEMGMPLVFGIFLDSNFEEGRCLTYSDEEE